VKDTILFVEYIFIGSNKLTFDVQHWGIGDFQSALLTYMTGLAQYQTFCSA